MRRGEVWFASVPDGGDRPVLVLTRNPTADRIARIVVAALTRTERGLVSEVRLTKEHDRVSADCVISFDNLHTLPRSNFRRHVTTLSPQRMREACQALNDALGCNR